MLHQGGNWERFGVWLLVPANVSSARPVTCEAEGRGVEDYVEKVMLADQGVKVLTCNLLVPREEVMGVQPGKGMSGLVLGRKQKKILL